MGHNFVTLILYDDLLGAESPLLVKICEIWADYKDSCWALPIIQKMICADDTAGNITIVWLLIWAFGRLDLRIMLLSYFSL